MPESFEAWLNRVDHELVKLCGLGSSELPDCVDLWSSWDAGESPSQAAAEVFTQAGGGGNSWPF